jgi:outer membrane autotransporter protein
MVAGGGVPAAAQSAIWDTTLSNTHWYVPVPQLLAYAAPRTGFSNPVPIGDQTLWSLGAATNGAFAGTSTAQLSIGTNLATENSTIQGFVTTAGQITMVFTPTSGGTSTVGLGQMRLINGTANMEMQMITGQNLLITHWAYMLPYDPATFTPPPSQPVPANSVPQWAWMAGTPWRIVSPAMFGHATPGRFVVTDYQNGYFWGSGVAPAGSSGGNFTLLGSVTPEGRVLFNTLSRGNLTSLYGTASGDASGAQMIASTYDLQGNLTGGLAYLSLVQPYTDVIAAQGNRAGLGAAGVLYRMAGTSASLTGPMAPVFEVLDNLSAPGLSTAISQTLPVLTGAASQATYAAQRALQQAVTGRLDQFYSLNAGVAAERNVWLKPTGGIAEQSGRDGALGYRASGGGLVGGIDGAISPRATLGGVFAYSRQAITGSEDAVANRLSIDSYQFGLYGAYALRPDTEVDFQLDGGINDNNENRSLTFMNRAAQASYRSYAGHAGLAFKKLIPIQPGFTLLPSLRLDYGQIRADAYREGGAGGLNLNVDTQVYRELMVTAGLKGAVQIANHAWLTADAGVGYNMLNERLRISAAFAGGGDSFVTSGLGLSPWLYSVGVGLVAAQNDQLDLSVRYGLQATPSGFLQQAGSVVLRMKL